MATEPGGKGSSDTPTALSAKHRSASGMCSVVGAGTPMADIILTPLLGSISPEEDTGSCTPRASHHRHLPNTDTYLSAHVLRSKLGSILQKSSSTSGFIPHPKRLPAPLNGETVLSATKGREIPLGQGTGRNEALKYLYDKGRRGY